LVRYAGLVATALLIVGFSLMAATLGLETRLLFQRVPMSKRPWGIAIVYALGAGCLGAAAIMRILGVD